MAPSTRSTPLVPRLVRQSAFDHVRITPAGRRLARTLLLEPDRIYLYWKTHDRGETRHHLSLGPQEWSLPPHLVPKLCRVTC